MEWLLCSQLTNYDDKNPKIKGRKLALTIPRHVFTHLLVIIFANVPCIIWCSLVARRGLVEVTSTLHDMGSRHHQQNSSPANIWILNTCYSMPLYSHVHANVSLRFLTCWPNLNYDPKYKEEDDLFYADPEKWIKEENLHSTPPTHVVLFQNLYSKLKKTFDELQFEICHKIYNYQVLGARADVHLHKTSHASQYILILCKNSLKV